MCVFVFVFVCVCLRLRVQVSQGAISDLLLASCNDVQEIERPKPFTHHHFFQVDLSSRKRFPTHTHTHTHTLSLSLSHTHTPVCAFVYGCSWSLQAGRCACLQRVRTIVRNGSSCCSNASQRGKQPKLAVSLRAPSPFCPPPLTSDSLCLILDAVVVLPGPSIVLLTHLLLLWPWQSF